MNNTWHTIGRIVFALPFAIFGILHFINAGQMAGFVPAFIPGGVIWVYLTGAALLAASISILAQKMTRLACILLGVLLLIFVLTIHLPGVIESGGESGMPNLLKDLALAGASWFIAGSYGSDAAV
jgi:uncharacterized membrane protein